MATPVVENDLLALIASILLSGRDLKQICHDESIKDALEVATRIWEATHPVSCRSLSRQSRPEPLFPPEKWGWQ